MPPIKRTKFKLVPEQLLEMFYWLKLIRAFDERLSVLVKQGKVRSGVYTGIGQEAIIVGTCYGLRKDDYICPLHRDLGSFLMKGVEARTMMSQMFAKTTGLSKGRDSALHSGVSELGIFGNTSMLGANLPVAAGLALTYKMERTDHVVVAYFGEGASNVGDFHEALYRSDEELAMWKSRDPIPTFTTYLGARHVLDDDKQKDVDARVAATIDDAVEFAMNGPDPDPGEAVMDLYA